jgi:hypothetical protein
MSSSTRLGFKKRRAGNAGPTKFVFSVTTMLVTLLVYGFVACDSSLSQPEPAEPQISSALFTNVPLYAVKDQHTAVQLSDISLQNVGIPTPGLVTLEPFGRSAFPHSIDAKFKFKYGNKTEIVQIDDVSDVIAARLTIQEGGSVGWHRHPGSAIGIVVSGTFGVIEETDCVVRTYSAGEAVFHRGQGILDVGFNAGEGDVVVYLTFMGVPTGQGPTLPHPNGESPCPI